MSKKIFISHSSKDKVFVRKLANDLKIIGHDVWLDEWEIKVGECIVSKIEEGIKNSEYVIIVLSESSVNSGWVEKEWKSKYWDEISHSRILVLPAIIEECEIPELLKTKKYADFTKNYSIPFFELNKSIQPLVKSNPNSNEIVISDANENRILERDLQYSTVLESYKNIPDILRLYDDKREVICVESYKSSDNIGFDLYLTRDYIIEDSEIYFLYLHRGTANYRTYEFIKDKYMKRLKLEQMIILLESDKKTVDILKRKKNITDLYGTEKVFFLNEFIWKYCNNDEFRRNENVHVSDFIEPYLKNERKKALAYIEEWIDGEDDCLVIKGGGGIGKTTIVKKINSVISEKYITVKVIYIDVNAVKNKLTRYSEMSDHDIDLYDLYVVGNGGPEFVSNDGVISRELFKLNYALGNIVFIVDGLDEIISKYGDKFDLHSFLESIKEYNNEDVSSIRKSKVLMTGRNIFLNKRYADNTDTEIEIAPFDKTMAKMYFESCFSENKRFVDKGMNLASTLMGGEGKIEYIPFVLDIIRRILVETKGGAKLEDVSFDSILLDINNRYDYVVYRVCYREIEKYDFGINVDMQIQFFMKMACEYDSVLKSGKVKNVLGDITGRNIKSKTMDALYSHPILCSFQDCIKFNYDFFESYFKNIFLYDYLMGNCQCDDTLKYVLSKKMGKFAINDISGRLRHISEEMIIRFIETIEWIRSQEDLAEEDKDDIISILFIIAIKVMHVSKSNTKDVNTEVMNNLFGSGAGVISDVVIKGISEEECDRLVFDFRGLHIKKSKFIDYNKFWECEFDNETLFEECDFERVHMRKNITTKAIQKNFNACNGDKSYYNAIEKQNEDNSGNIKSALTDVKIFLKLFYVRGNMLPLKEDVIRATFKGDAIRYIKILSENDLIERHVSEKKKLGLQWKIKNKYAEGCTKFCFEGVMIKKINDIIKIVAEKE